VQRAQLRDDEEQEDHAWTPGIQKVLPPLPLPHAAQRKQIVIGFKWKVASGFALTRRFPL
jgi:hypothetical protein